MADGRLRAQWQQTASLAAWVHASMTGQTKDPNDLMPPRLRLGKPVPKTTVDDKTPERIEAESAALRKLFGSKQLL